MKIKIFAKHEGEEEIEITDLYWFEENGVHAFEGNLLDTGGFAFRFEFHDTEIELIPTRKKIVLVQHADGTREVDPSLK